ncbi:MerR family transcriptional regulator [Nocardia cyriacigeorgica]|uniref:MerR family transcriptional regulator n=1 Tax=Nocardia cyriacigeorgica TaxID=135487 RepID=UPI000CEB6075|nr:MerR family transcriptional regulator [Nocardia cyriacigeorgica]AVH24833.1 MerR family transcriptional regulator [Nocardia cyriacigeorgica]MBF6089210.1 MerR family transcriptional regulator [Nocardia cyriacigeorgica]MBF6093929.1 MerR family transcriptional regulator [Nocardia cyriacigeorgica]MBF6398071.1 MerR family transcriptional regulator [Nocardia cyriacigeorgica]MBF6404415.1 MerR family transcriptional regulator [Nocardia cyriacigeorgica]
MAAEAEYTIDELARVADTTVRSVRVYHERGLLPSPDVRGRIGYYGSDHLNRLQTISRLLGRGMKLNGIRELLDAWDRGDGLADVLGVADQPAAEPSTGSRPADEPKEREPQPELPDYVKQALAASDDPLDAYRVTNPRCCDLATRLSDAGLEVDATFQFVERLRADCDRIADRYASEVFYLLAGQSYEQSARTPKDRTKLETDLAIARLIATRAASELIDQAFARHAELPAPMATDGV